MEGARTTTDGTGGASGVRTTGGGEARTMTGSTNRIDRFLRLMNDRGASDLHLSVGCAPIFRQGGQVDPIRFKQLTNRDWVSFIRPITPPEYWKEFLRLGDMDFAYAVPELARFRVNLFMQERGYGAVFRIIPTELMTLQQLGLPRALRKIVQMKRGLVLVTGPTGSGKSTTLSAIINEINETRALHIVTIEDPIEFVHPNKRSLITQREVGPHTHSFSDALKAAVREDPNLILVGEMRDLETISLALHAAETGLLVFGTLHTNCAAKTVDRVVNVFPEDEQATVKNVLAENLQAVLAQQLLRKEGGGRCAAVEILFKTPALGTLIRDDKTYQITNLISTGKRAGMISMDASLWTLMEEGKVKPEAAFEKAIDKKVFKERLEGRGIQVI